MLNFEKHWDEIKEVCLPRENPNYCPIRSVLMKETCSGGCTACNLKMAEWLVAKADDEPVLDNVKDTVFAILIDEICRLLKTYPDHDELNSELFEVISSDPEVCNGVDLNLSLCDILKSTIVQETDGYLRMRGL